MTASPHPFNKGQINLGVFICGFLVGAAAVALALALGGP